MNPLALFTGPYGMLAKWGVIALLAGAVFTTGWVKGNQHGTEKLIKFQGEQAVAKIAIITKIEKLKGEVHERWHAAETRIVTVYETLEEDAAAVPSRAECNVTVGWMRQHDNAAAGVSGRDEGSVDAKADTGITETQSASVVTRNYKAYHQVANDLTACRGFVSGLAAATQ